MDKAFRVASYNIHQCVGRDGRKDCERIVQIIREFRAQVIGLQEVDLQVDFLTDATGLAAIRGPTMRHPNSEYGNVLLTKFPISEARHIDLSVAGREPRGAIDAVLHINRQPVHILVTHLGLRSYERHYQIKRFKTLLPNSTVGCMIVFGDINEWFPLSRVLRTLNRHLGKSPSPKTFLSRIPLFALDRIWVQPDSALKTLQVHNTPLARISSDHLPLKATINAAY